MTDAQRSPEAPTSADDGSAPPAGEAVTGEVVEDQRRGGESIEQPAKVMRIGAMTKQLLEEVREAPLDEAARSRLKEIYETSVNELAAGLSDELRDELCRYALPLDEEYPSDAVLRVAQGQLVGWLEGLFAGIQATLFAQQMAARQQIEQLSQQRGLPPGMVAAQQGRPQPAGDASERPGTYL